MRPKGGQRVSTASPIFGKAIALVALADAGFLGTVEEFGEGKRPSR
jgi:hypothetical protein